MIVPKRNERAMKKAAIGLILSLLAGTACWPFDDEGPLPDMTVRVSRGVIEIHRGDEVIEVENEAQLEPHDVVKTSDGAAAVFALEDGRQGEIAGASQVRILDETRLELAAGSLLAEADTQMDVRFGEVEATTSGGVFRVDLGFASATAATYRGVTRMSAPGEAVMPVDRYYKVPVAADDLPNSPDPYRLDARDPWDLEYYASEVELDKELEQLMGGFKTQLGRDRPGLSYFRALAGGRDVSFMKPYLKSQSVDDLLIAFQIADGAPGSFRGSFEEAFDLFDDGASWGIVAAIMEVSYRPLAAQLERIVLGTGVADAGGGPEFTAAAAAAATDGGGQVASSDPGGSDSNTGGGDDNNTGNGGPGPKPTPRPTQSPEDCTDEIDCTVDEVADKVPGPTPTPSGLAP